jgi:uncharacterized small protein (DUF1192 family)
LSDLVVSAHLLAGGNIVTESAPSFSIVSEGYAPGEVDARIAELLAEIRELKADLAEAAATGAPDSAAAFAALGAHVANLVKVAYETGARMQADAEQRVAELAEQRQAIVAELARLRDHLPSLLGSETTAASSKSRRAASGA